MRISIRLGWQRFNGENVVGGANDDWRMVRAAGTGKTAAAAAADVHNHSAAQSSGVERSADCERAARKASIHDCM